MRLHHREMGHDEYWPAYTDILMVMSLVLILLSISFLLSRNHDYIKDEQERRKSKFLDSFNTTMASEKARSLIFIASPPGERQIISFSDQLLFDKCSAELKKQQGQQSLAKLSRLLVKFFRPRAQINQVKVNGHTDEDPIQTVEFPSNWHLSSARATSVVYFLTRHGLDPHRLSATGYAEFHPVDPFGKPIKAMARKRRIEVELLYPSDWIEKQLAHRR